jgi:hypothetical protein
MPQGTNIPDLDGAILTTEKHLVMGRIRNSIYEFFFRRLLVGDRGPRNALIVFFFHKLHQECVKEFGETPVWDETNETRLMMILARLNFEDLNQWQPRKTKTKGKPE